MQIFLRHILIIHMLIYVENPMKQMLKSKRTKTHVEFYAIYNCFHTIFFIVKRYQHHTTYIMINKC